MVKKLKLYIIAITVAMLFPYIVTLCLHPNQVMEAAGPIEEQYVKVQTGGEEKITQKLPLSTYGIGILANEMDSSNKKEALMAQAILIRTALYRTLQEKGHDATFDTAYWTTADMEKNWGSVKGNLNYKKIKSAWEDTEGKVVFYKDKLAITPYHKVSNGSTRDGKEVFGTEDYPYLKIVDCPLDVESPQQLKTISVSNVNAEAVKYDSAGYVLAVEMGKEKCTGEEFRELYHLNSSSFVIQNYEGKLRITTRGVGHGLGMSQFTAEKMAENGKTYQDIIQYFFQNVQIKEVTEILGWAE